MHSMIRFAPVRSRSASRRSGSSGWVLRASMTAKPASSSTDAASEADHLGVAPVRDPVGVGGRCTAW